MKTVLTIAGSDSSGGAGIQADIKTMTMNGIYAMSAVTALTAQNTTGVFDTRTVDPAFLKEELDAVFTDIFPDAVKIGMIGTADLIRAIAERLRFYHAKSIVLDPVMISTSGTRLLDKEAIETLKKELFPLADVVTPNIPEAEVLSGLRIQSAADMEEAAAGIAGRYHCAVLLKGGHAAGNADDLLFDGGEFLWFKSPRIDNPNTHGTGCTLSSAIASNLAKGLDLAASVKKAKYYITGAIAAGLNLGHGNGPLMHNFAL